MNFLANNHSFIYICQQETQKMKKMPQPIHIVAVFFIKFKDQILAMKKVVIILVVAFILIQFFRIDKTNPPINKGMDFLTVKKTPEPMAKTIKNACYDCHSNETKYPWYSNIQPVAWFLKDHIDEGRKHLNFSTYATYELKRQAHKMEEAAEMVEKGEMPLESYVLGHPEAKLTDTQKSELVNYFKKIQADTETANNIPHNEPNKSVSERQPF